MQEAMFLREIYQDNWREYRRSLGGGKTWDYCILTASDEHQAKNYRLQLSSRKEKGLLPRKLTEAL